MIIVTGGIDSKETWAIILHSKKNKIYLRVDHFMKEYLHYFIAARNTIASAALGELPSLIPGWRTDQFSRSFLPAAVRLWNLLPSGTFSSGTFSSFKSAMNLCYWKLSLIFLPLF